MLATTRDSLKSLKHCLKKRDHFYKQYREYDGYVKKNEEIILSRFADKLPKDLKPESYIAYVVDGEMVACGYYNRSSKLESWIYLGESLILDKDCIVITEGEEE